MSGQRWHAIQRFSARQTSSPPQTTRTPPLSPAQWPLPLPTITLPSFATPVTLLLLALSLALPFLFSFLRRRILHTPRTKLIPPRTERVLIIGGSSGIGRAIALMYAERGARVCLTGRREEEARRVGEECEVVRGVSASARGIEERGQAGKEGGTGERVIGVGADFTDAGVMVGLRERLEREWGGLDTIIVSAGVSALQPLLTLAGVEPGPGSSDGGSVSVPGVEGVERAKRIAGAAVEGNFVGPLVAAVTFIPLLQHSSPSPSLHLISSLAASIPAPTRSLYASTKSASLALYRGLSIEHPRIGFTYSLPSTVEGGFRAGAVDAGLGPLHEDDPNPDPHPNSQPDPKTGTRTKGKGQGAVKGLKKEYVARRVLEIVDGSGPGGWARGQAVFVPGWYWGVQFLYAVWPGFVERRAARKYHFSAGAVGKGGRV